MIDDEDLFAELELAAYRPPAVPVGLADRVIARVHAADQAVAASVAAKRTYARRRRYAVGAATVVAAGAVTLWRVREDASGLKPSGSLVAKAPEHLVLEGVIANLDPGADVTWRRSRATTHADQRTGAATWAVPPDHMFSLDVGTAAAPGASIAATDATFRVETRMNLSDARTGGLAAVTASSMALITVVVYVGHINVTGAGQTVIAKPGTTTTIEPGKAPGQLLATACGPLAPAVPATLDAGAEVWITSGETATIHDAKTETIVGVHTTCSHSSQLRWQTPRSTIHESTQLDPAMTLTAGIYEYDVTCDGASQPSARGAITLVHPTAAPAKNVLVIESVQQGSFDRQAWPEQWQLSGRADAEVRVSASGAMVDTDADGRFRVMMAEPQKLPPLVLRAEHPTRGIHYYVSRPAR
jgi:hypothetical protein